MSLVKFTELPSGSIQGGDVLAVAGASSYKVTATELANWTNARVQGATDKTIAEVYQFVANNTNYINNVINPQLGQIGTNKTNIATNANGIVTNTLNINANDTQITADLLRQYDNERSVIANMIMTNNYIKNPAAHHIALYYKEQSLQDTSPIMDSRLIEENLEYPGWSRAGEFLTYNFSVACKGAFTMGVLGGTGAFEYQIDGGGWVVVDGSGATIKTVNLNYIDGVNISIRVNRAFGGIAFGIVGAAYWLSAAGVKGGGVDTGLKELTYSLKRKRIDLVACGYWFGQASSEHEANTIIKPNGIGYITRWRTFETTSLLPAIERFSAFTDNTRNVMRLPDSGRSSDWMFASTDPNLFDQAEVF